MIDRFILIRLLEILDRLNGVPLADYVLVSELALRALRPLSADEVRDHIQYAADKGWITSSTGLLGEPRWARTLAGKAALGDLRISP